MSRLKKTEEIVRQILIDVPATRDSDEFLYIVFVERVCPKSSSLSLMEFMTSRKDLNISSLESVGRTRRKIQEKEEELRGTEATTEARFEEWKRYREYAFE